MGFVFKSCSSEDLLVQQRSGWSSAKGRLRREDCEFVKHDKLFSNWKILVGPSDWSDHMAGRVGIDRYHLHNLPAAHFGPGVYELGVTTPSWSPTSHRQRTRTLKREDVMAVYVGQADNIRLRLQKYGQGGSHLEGSRSLSTKFYQGDDDSTSGGSTSSLGSIDSGSKTSCSGPHFFSEVFALGSAVAFRWAQTDSKVVAQQVESELLAVFDYAWNKGSNGNRRSRDILAKLFMVWPRNDAFCNPLFSGKKYIFCGTNAVGIKVALRKPLDAPYKSNSYFMTTPPHVPVSVRSPVRLASLELRCGVLTDQGTPCDTPPVKGRKRCLQHKGMRVRGAPAPGNALLLPASEEFNVKRESVKVGGGSFCLPRGFLGRSRPKSRPDCSTDSKSVCKKEHDVGRRQPSLSFNTWMKMENEKAHDSQEPSWSQSTDNEEWTPSKSNKNLGYFMTMPPQVPVRLASLELRCGVLIDQGRPCSTPPVKGRKRCLQHKGMRVRGAPTAGNAPLLPATDEYNVKRESVKVGGGSVCIPRGFLGRRPVCSPDSKPVCKTECKEEPEVGRRQPSLSFNTENEEVYASILFHERFQNTEFGRSAPSTLPCLWMTVRGGRVAEEVVRVCSVR